MDDLSAMAYEMREDVLDMTCRAGTRHIGGDFSMTGILTDLYFRQVNISSESMDDRDRDRFVLSKGHSVESYCTVLARKGLLDIGEIKVRFSAFNSPCIGHSNSKLPDIEVNSGSLGHGLPVCVSMALAGKMDQRDYRVYTMMGDGELAEGSVWEGVMTASHYKLDNLCTVMDRNRLQISGPIEEIVHHDDLGQRLSNFDWHVVTADGNNISSLDRAFGEARQQREQPTVVIANTIKGRGVSFMENQAGWHHRVPTDEEYQAAVRELGEKMKGGGICIRIGLQTVR